MEKNPAVSAWSEGAAGAQGGDGRAIAIGKDVGRRRRGRAGEDPVDLGASGQG